MPYESDEYEDGVRETKRQLGDAAGIAAKYLRQIRMGYTLEVTLQEVLEEIERSER